MKTIAHFMSFAAFMVLSGCLYLTALPQQAQAASDTSSFQKGRTSQSTHRITVKKGDRLHVVINANTSDLTPSHRTFKYRIFKNGDAVKAAHAKNGHVTKTFSVKPGQYSVRAYDAQDKLLFSGGVSASDHPHFL
ncbi:hypothetical protein [uncultured Secundilactobacillus sp.]|uniref:hypothetical protein n=1 Tax=uncultured Secundilactobacillus sp. TaxID=2813935 RepID=UPI002588DC0D|nr:hypothetical protein [uncultured Secundilactobacillus sp.]